MGTVPNAESVCLLVSGGLDSSVLAKKLSSSSNHIVPLYVRCGLAWEDTELYYLKKFLQTVNVRPLQTLNVIEMPIDDIYEGHWSITGNDIPDSNSEDPSVYLPGRNLLLLSKTAVFCAQKKINCIALASLSNNPFPDATNSFFCQFEKMASIGLANPIKIITPFANHTKSEVILEGQNLPLHLTFSCIDPINNQHCGSCNKCEERISAFATSGVKDPTNYSESRITRF